jgi:hypothetical protein
MQKRIIPLLLVVSALSFMLVFSDNIKSVYALSISNIIISGAGSAQMTYSIPNNRYVLNAGAGVITTVNPTTKASASVTLPAIAGESYGTGATCSATLTSCYIVSSGSGLPDKIRTYNPITGSIITDITVDTANAIINIAGISAVSGSTRGNSGWFTATCTAGGSVLFNIVGQVLGACGGTTAVQSGSSLLDVIQSGSNVAITTSSATNSFRIFNSGTGLLVCNANINVGTGGTLETYNSNFYVVVGTNTISKYSSSCVLGTGITASGISSQVFGLLAVEPEGVFAVEGTTSISFMNITSTNINTVAYTVATNFTETVTTIRGERLAYAYGFNQTGLNIDVATANDPFVFIQYVPAGGNVPNNHIIDGICYGTLAQCLAENGGSLSGFTNGGSQYNITEAGTIIGQGLGVIDPDNDDPQTNGIGLFYMLATGTLFAGITFATVATVNNRFHANISYTEIPKEFWLFLVIGVVSLAFYLHWIPDIVFYGLVIGLAGLFSFGLYRHFAKGD